MVANSLYLIPGPLTKRKQALVIFLALNTLALLHFGLLQLRYVFSDYYMYDQATQFVKLIGTYNVWVVGGIMLLRYLPDRARWYQHLGLFLAFMSFYCLSSAMFYNSDPYRIWRGFIINMTGLIHLNLLFYLAILFFIRQFKNTAPQPALVQDKLMIKEGKTMRCFDKADIVSIKAEQNYILLELHDQPPVMLRKTLKEVENLIGEDHRFLRIQRSYIMNKAFISELSRAANGTDLICKTTTGGEFPVSRKKKDWLRSQLDI